ncbi:MAG: hypothetical protein KDD35_02315 [Bdellovibrionales bacterium]|nr:hypothetical protein [Bdellovibrionales bacterium]
MKDKLSRLLSLGEIESSERLQTVFWAIWSLLIYDMTALSVGPARNGETPTCWEHIPNCSSLIPTLTLPNSYLYTTMIAALLSFLFGAAYFARRKIWIHAHLLLLIVFLWKFTWNMLIFDYGTSNFDYFLFIPALIFFFSSRKLEQMRFLWAALYLFAALVKTDESWIAGTYFSSTITGLPLFSDALIPFITNLTILFELICSVGLIAKNQRWAKFSLWAWTAFHLYSSIMVGFFYPVRCLAFLWIIFGSNKKNHKERAQERTPHHLSLCGTLVMLYLSVANLLPRSISPYPKETFEAMNYGFHMFDANHQCLFRFKTFDSQGELIKDIEIGSSHPMFRCYPQWVLQKTKRLNCPDHSTTDIQRVEWQMLHSKNGGPFFETVNTKNACEIEFLPFRRNKWIRTEADGAPLIGYPEKNAFYSQGMGPSPIIHPSPQIELSPFQNWIVKHLYFFQTFYWLLWSGLYFHLLYLGFRSRIDYTLIRRFLKIESDKV